MSAKSQKYKPKALFFDVFGTVVDWRSTVTEYLSSRSASTLESPHNSFSSQLHLACADISWANFAQEWRSSYYLFTGAQAERKAKGEDVAFKTVDDHHYDSLRELLTQHGIRELWTDEEVKEISRIWHALNAWTDSLQGLQHLKDLGLTICTLSNGNISLLQDMAEFANLPWTHILSAEKFGAYKPHPSVYEGACEELCLRPHECTMVAAHLGDLQAAQACGLQTVYIQRPEEEAWPADNVREVRCF